MRLLNPRKGLGGPGTMAGVKEWHGASEEAACTSRLRPDSGKEVSGAFGNARHSWSSSRSRWTSASC